MICLFHKCTKEAITMKDLGSGMCFAHLMKARENEYNYPTLCQDSTSRLYLLDLDHLAKLLDPIDFTEND